MLPGTAKRRIHTVLINFNRSKRQERYECAHAHVRALGSLESLLRLLRDSQGRPGRALMLVRTQGRTLGGLGSPDLGPTSLPES